MARSVVSLLAVVLLAQATFAVDFWYFYNGNWYPYRRDATRGYVLLPNTGKNGQPPNSPNTANVPPVNRARTSSVQPAIAFAANGDLWYFYYGNWHAYRRNAKGEWVLLTNTVKNAVPPPPPVHNAVGSLPVNNGRAGYVQPPNAPAANIPQPPAAGKTSDVPLSSIVRRTIYASPVYNVRSGYAPPPYTYVLPQYAHAPPPPPPPPPSGNRPAPRYSPVLPPPPPAANKPAIQTLYNLPAPAAAPAPPRYAHVPPPPPFGSMPAAPFQYNQLAPAPPPIDPFYPDGIKDFGVIPVTDPLSVDPVSEPCNRPCLACECGDYECYKRKCDK